MIEILVLGTPGCQISISVPVLLQGQPYGPSSSSFVHFDSSTAPRVLPEDCVRARLAAGWRPSMLGHFRQPACHFVRLLHVPTVAATSWQKPGCAQVLQEHSRHVAPSAHASHARIVSCESLHTCQPGALPAATALPALVGGGFLSTPASAASEVPAAASARACAGLSSQCLTRGLCALQTRTGLHVPRRPIPASLGQHLPARGVERRSLLCPGLAPPGLCALPSAA